MQIDEYEAVPYMPGKVFSSMGQAFRPLPVKVPRLRRWGSVGRLIAGQVSNPVA